MCCDEELEEMLSQTFHTFKHRFKKDVEMKGRNYPMQDLADFLQVVFNFTQTLQGTLKLDKIQMTYFPSKIAQILLKWCKKLYLVHQNF